jgi:hypothetical protein
VVGKLGIGYATAIQDDIKKTTSDWTHPVHLLDQQIYPNNPPVNRSHIPSVPPDQRISRIPHIFLEDEHLSIPAWQGTVRLVQSRIGCGGGVVVVQSMEDRMRSRWGNFGKASLPGGNLYSESVHPDSFRSVQALLRMHCRHEDCGQLTWYLSTSCNQ